MDKNFWTHELGCTDATKQPPHPRPMRRRASDAAACASVPRPVFFFSRLGSDSGRFPPNRAVSGETAESVRIGRNRRIGPYRAKPPKHTDTGNEPADLGRNSKKKRDVLRYVGDVRECLCVRQRENKLNKYLSAFGIKRVSLWSILLLMFSCVSCLCFGWLYCFLSFRLMKFHSPFKKKKKREWVVGVGRVIIRGDI